MTHEHFRLYHIMTTVKHFFAHKNAIHLRKTRNINFLYYFLMQSHNDVVISVYLFKIYKKRYPHLITLFR